VGGIVKKVKNKEKDKAYIKALDYYENGELDKAIKKCDKAISKNIKNRAAFNLKGLILYIKGDLEGARGAWKANSECNGDNLAKNYMADSKSDLERLRKYKEAEKLLKELRIDEAIVLLKLCKKSTFNSIKVNLALAICYMRKGDYKACSIYITEVLNQDKNNVEGNKIAKQLYDINKIKITTSRRKGGFVKALVCMTIIISVGMLSFITISTLKNRVNNDTSSKEVALEEDRTDKPQESEEDTDVKNEEESGNDTEETGKTKVEVNFDELQENITNKEFNAVYSKLELIGNKALTGKEKTVYINAKQLLKKEGVQYFYDEGSRLYNEKAFKEAREEFRKGYKYAEDSYLKPHIIFFDASISEKLGDNEEAIKMFEEYYNNYKSGDYMAETVYKLAILYKDMDIDRSVLYAEEIKEKYSDTMYNNDVITNLLNSVE